MRSPVLDFWLCGLEIFWHIPSWLKHDLWVFGVWVTMPQAHCCVVPSSWSRFTLYVCRDHGARRRLHCCDVFIVTQFTYCVRSVRACKTWVIHFPGNVKWFYGRHPTQTAAARCLLLPYYVKAVAMCVFHFVWMNVPVDGEKSTLMYDCVFMSYLNIVHYSPEQSCSALRGLPKCQTVLTKQRLSQIFIFLKEKLSLGCYVTRLINESTSYEVAFWWDDVFIYKRVRMLFSHTFVKLDPWPVHWEKFRKCFRCASRIYIFINSQSEWCGMVHSWLWLPFFVVSITNCSRVTGLHIGL